MTDEPICNCPLCGRTHRKMPSGTPPASISDTVTIPRAQHEALMGAVKTLPGAERVLGELSGDGYDEYHAVWTALAALRAAGIPEEDK